MIRIVVAEGAFEVRRSLIEALAGDARFTIDGQTDNGFEAVLMAEDMRPDLILLDLLMPVMTGYAAIPEIHKASPRTKVILYSAVAPSDEELEALGIDTYFCKSDVAPDAVVRRLTELIPAA